jgi:hypothetical protein
VVEFDTSTLSRREAERERHFQTNKTDPGPALDWDYLIGNARQLMSGTDTSLGHMRKRL